MSTEDGAKIFASGLLDHYEPTLKKLQKQLSDLITRQGSTLQEIETENAKFSNINNSELNNMFLMIKEYQIRLMNVKKEMLQLSERSIRIKKRALRLQENKQREALENAHYREAQLKREQDLIPKPTTKVIRPGTSSSSTQR